MNNTLLTAFGCLIIFVATTFGALIVFFFKKDFNKKVNSIICGFSSGIMISASIWGLIMPALSQSENMGKWSFLPVAIGLVVGALFLVVVDIVVNKINSKSKTGELEGTIAKNKLTRFVVAFTFHNIPEGMAVGFAFGTALNSGEASSFIAAMGIAIGIAIQNIPEGMAVALPVYKHTGKKGFSFLIGMLSGIVEPIFAFVGVMLASKISVLLPWLLAFSAGSMLFVSFEDLIPEANETYPKLGTWALMVGFIVMMILDIALG